VRAAVAAGDTEIDEQLSDRFRGHRRAPIGVQGEGVAPDALTRLRRLRVLFEGSRGRDLVLCVAGRRLVVNL
jgi:hypothetical protein